MAPLSLSPNIFMMSRNDLLHANGCLTPMATSPLLSKDLGTPLLDGTQYRQVVGTL